MPIFKLHNTGTNIDNAILVPATKTNLEMEKHLEGWLESSPWAIAQESIIIIGRQENARTEDGGSLFPDLLGIDKDGNLVIIELKKGRTPRDVISQLLEYAAWANDLSGEKIHEMADNYLNRNNSETVLEKVFFETFETDVLPSLNQKLRLFVAAEEIAPSVAKVCRFLRQVHGVDVSCVQFHVFQTESGEILVNSENIVGLEDFSEKSMGKQKRWSGSKTVKQIVWENVEEFTKKDSCISFQPKEIVQLIHTKNPEIKRTTICCQIISDCVNHPSRHHYPGGIDRYWRLDKGKYRIYDSKKDDTKKISGS